MSRRMPRIYLHIGVPKTGTTYLQDILFRNRRQFAEQGVLYPAPYAEAHFDAAVDLRDMAFKGHADPAVSGRWERIARAATSWDGHAVVVSHELLAGADEDAIAAAVRSLAGHEVHVVVTARDLGRQVPAVWQEYVKNHSTVTFQAYAERLAREPPSQKAARIFWRQQHLVEVLRRWSTAVSDDRMHLVTVPPAGAEPLLLWHRFAAAARLPSGGYDAAAAARNPSLGFAEAELLRRVNRSLGETLEWPEYEATVKAWFAESVLAGRGGSGAPAVPRELRPWFDERAQTMIDDLAAWGLPVEGDLADLRPRWPSEADSVVDDAQVLNAAVDAVAHLLRELARRHGTGRGRRLVHAARRNPVVRRLPGPVQEWLKRRVNPEREAPW